MSVATVYGVPEGFDAVLLARRAAEAKGTLLHVARDDQRLARLADGLSFFAPDAELLKFPAWDCLPYDRVSPNAEIVSERIATLARLLEPASGPRIVLTTVNALVQRVPPRHVFRGSSRTIAVNGTLKTEELARFLEANGYGRAATVMEPGEYAMRGGIIDIFAAGQSDPVRLDLFGDTVESIRPFDSATQRGGTTKLDRLVLRPVNEVFLDRDSISRFRVGWRELFSDAAATDPVYLSISDGRRHPGMEHWVPLFHDAMETLLDYTGIDTSVSLDHQWDEVLANRLEMVADHYSARHGVVREGETPYRPLPASRLYLDHAEWDEMLSYGPLFAFTPFARPDGAAGVDGGGRPAPVFAKSAGIDVFAQARPQFETWINQGRRPVVAAWSRGSRERIGHLLADHQIRTEAVDDLAALTRLPPGITGLVVLGLDRGFLTDTIAVVSETDLLGERISRPPRKRKRADQFIAEATEIADGDLVVHQDHGIARYDGLVTLHVSGAPHDCLRLLYDGDDKLFLPVENIEMLSRFGSEGGGVGLDKLGGASWQTRKARMKQRIRDMAGELIRTAAARRMRDAEMMTPSEGAWDEFCARFPFAETDDQARAIADVLEDLAAGRPMDRLICGDVGFGKTEVALRAAFKVVTAGKQVAILCPTTVLAAQHHQTFTERLAAYPIQIDLLSRFRSRQEQAKTLEGLRAGTVDIVIGTHRLLSKDVVFSNLGMIVVDEEQRFGVTHKERLKQMRTQVDVLTLSATPIPRTMSMALSGLRDMSVIEDPPEGRIPVLTYVREYEDNMIRDAILRELERDGQIYFVHNKIESIDHVASHLRKLVPDLRIEVGHGQMSEDELERVMFDFYHHKADLLLCTTIIENGLDIPNSNTIIIDNADHMGLSQLYQLRGRVGRSSRQAYSYFLYRRNKQLSEVSERRLAAIKEFSALGSGYKVAMRDLEIRGAGNLLGAQQSGAMMSVGFDLYTQLLAQAVQELKGEEVTEDILPSVDLPITAHIPNDYIPGEAERIYFYKRMSGVRSVQDIESLQAELEDRFGDPPQPVWDALAILRLRLKCKEMGIASIKSERIDVQIRFAPNVRLTPDAVKLLTFAFRGQRFTPDGVIVPLTGPKVMVQVEEMLNVLAQALEHGKKPATGSGSGSGTTNSPRPVSAPPRKPQPATYKK